MVGELALPIPSLVICLMLGVPHEHHAFFQQKSSEALSVLSDQETVGAALTELSAFLDELVTAELAEPGDDLLSRLATEFLEPGVIDRGGMLTMTLLIAGFETTGNMISLGTALLLSHPDQLAAFLAGDDAFQRNAVEELLRYLTIAQHPRQFACVEDTEIGGNLIRAGEGVLISLPAANRDETAFEDADTSDLTRSSRRHLAFSYGVHQCLGQALARQELLLHFRTLFTRVPALRLVEAPEEFDLKKHVRAHGFNTLKVAWWPRIPSSSEARGSPANTAIGRDGKQALPPGPAGQ